MFRATGNTKIVPVLTGTQLIVNVIFSLGFVYFGRGTYLAFIGPCLGTLLGQIVLMGLNVYFLRKIFNYSLNDSLLGGYLPKLFAISVIPCIICMLLPYWPEELWLRVMSKGAAYSIMCGGWLLASGYISIPNRLRLFAQRQ